MLSVPRECLLFTILAEWLHLLNEFMLCLFRNSRVVLFARNISIDLLFWHKLRRKHGTHPRETCGHLVWIGLSAVQIHGARHLCESLVLLSSYIDFGGSWKVLIKSNVKLNNSNVKRERAVSRCKYKLHLNDLRDANLRVSESSG